MASISVLVKATNGDKHQIATEKSATVAEFKEAVAAKAAIPASSQRLIYKGSVTFVVLIRHFCSILLDRLTRF